MAGQGKLVLCLGKYDPVSKSMVQLPGETRATEIFRGRYSMDNLEEYPERYGIQE